MYGKRLQIEYNDINEVETRIEIWTQDYAGAVTLREYADEVGMKVIWGDSSGKQLPLIYGAQLSIYFYSETDYEFIEFFNADSRKNKILVYKANNLFMATFSEAETWDEPLISAPYPVALTGYDGLGLLKDEDFLDDNKDYYEGEMTPLAILQLILSKTGLALPLNTAVTIRPSGASAAADALTQVVKNVVTYRDMNCYEVLEALFKGNRIMQRNGEWWIIANDLWGNASITCYNYTAAGAANGTVNIDTKFTGFWFEDEGRLGFLPALKQITVKQDFGYKPNLIENGDFTGLENGDFENWQQVNLPFPAEQRVFDADGNKYILLRGHEEPPGDWETFERTSYMVSNPISVEASAVIPTLKLSYALAGLTYHHVWGFFGVWLEGTGGTDYALTPVIGLDEEGNKIIEYEWVVSSYARSIPFKSRVRRSNSLFGPITYEIQPEDLTAYPIEEITEHFEQIQVVFPGIPADGVLKVYLFITHLYDTDDLIQGMCYKDISLTIHDENNEEFPSDKELILVNNSGNNYVPSDIELINGDFPDNDNALALYEGGFKLASDGSKTAGWVVDGNATVYDYAELITRYTAAEMKLARQLYKVKLADTIPATALVFEDPDNGNKKLIEAGITYNDQMQTIEGRYVEVVTFNINSFTVLEKTNYSKSSKATSSGSSNNSTPQLGSLYHVEEDILRDLDSHTITVEFDLEFGSVPVGTRNLYAWRMRQRGNEWVQEPVFIKHPAKDWLTTTGFTVEIDPDESLTNVFVEYSFREKI